MRIALRHIFSDRADNLRGKVAGIYIILAAANLGAWAWALIAFGGNPLLMGTALLAYSFGLRHAFDADHIAAVDNVTRKLVQEGKRPVGVGFFFSLGHSTVVVVMAIIVAMTTATLAKHFGALKEIGGIVGTVVSALFLLAVAVANLSILVAVWRTFQKVTRERRMVEAEFDALMAGRGFMARLFRGLFRLIGKSWQMYPLGLLFGLGFDTATEVGLLGISAAEAGKGLSLWNVLVLPALFTAGMSLMDTTDGVLMLGAYGWAFVKPLRKLYYNLTITFVSVVVAVLIGGIEALGLIGDQLNLSGAFWTVIGMLNDHFGTLGYTIVGIFALSWLASLVIWRVKRYDQIEVT